MASVVDEDLGPHSTGSILRHEVPFPFVRLVLERRPETDASPDRIPRPGCQPHDRIVAA